MALTLDERQAVLDRYRFTDNGQASGKDLFPRDARQLTRAQGIHLDYLAGLVDYRNALRKTLAHLENVKKELQR